VPILKGFTKKIRDLGSKKTKPNKANLEQMQIIIDLAVGGR